MAYYAFSDSVPVANRSHLQTKLGQSATWLVGNKLVTVSTESSNLHSTLAGSAVTDSSDNQSISGLGGNQLTVNGDSTTLKESKEAPG